MSSNVDWWREVNDLNELAEKLMKKLYPDGCKCPVDAIDDQVCECCQSLEHLLDWPHESPVWAAEQILESLDYESKDLGEITEIIGVVMRVGELSIQKYPDKKEADND